MKNMLHTFKYTLENSESNLKYEFDSNSEKELEYDEPTQSTSKHVNPMWFIPGRHYAFTKNHTY